MDNVTNYISHCGKVVMLSTHVMYAPICLKGTCPWLLTGHLLLKLYHARFSQDLTHEPWSSLSRWKPQEEVPGPRCWRCLSNLTSIFMMHVSCLPCHHLRVTTHGILLDPYYWIYTMPVSARICTWAMVPSVGRRHIKVQRSKLLKGFLFQFKFWGVEQNLIPYVWQLLLANVPLMRWIIKPYKHNAEIVYAGMMTCDFRMVINWGRGFEVKCSPNLSPNVQIHQYILHLTLPCHTCTYL